MPAPLWKPGISPYALWLNDLRENHPEKYQEHMEKRRVKKSMKAMMNEVVMAQKESWLTLFNNGALKLMEQAINNGDTQAFCAVYDRFVGKPDSNVDITSGGKELQPPTIIFASEELDDWKDVG